jgi:hypothetical protein
MKGSHEALRIWAGKQTEGVRGWFASLGAWIKERKGRITPRRALAAVVALSLWMGMGRMDSSEVVIETEGEVFGEVHWYEK